MKTKLVLAAVLEIAYAIITRAWLPDVVSGIQLELVTSAFRVATAAVFWMLFREILLAPAPNVASAAHPLLAVALLCQLLAPVLTGDDRLGDTNTKMTFALTSITVAIHEEIVYRGVLQNLLQRRAGRFLAVVASSVVFALYHYGSEPFGWNLVNLFAAGCIFGLIYSVTGSLLFVIVLHAVVAGVWAFSPFLTPPVSSVVGLALMLLALMACAGWARLRASQAAPG